MTKLRTRKLAIFVNAATMVFLFAACSTTPANDSAAAIATLQSPLDEYLSAIAGTELSFEERTRRANQQEARWAELVTQCMHERGFEFDINNQPEGMWVGHHVTAVPDNAVLPNDPDWVSQWGYGITDSPAHSGISSSDIPQEGRPVLGDAELNAFNLALTGRPALPPFGETDDDNCMNFASNQLQTEIPEGLTTADEFAPLFDAISQMQDEFRQQVSNADIRWSQCMAEAGYPGFQRQWEAEDSIRKAWFETLGNFRGPAAEMEANEIALREKEIELAAADLACRESTGFSAERDADRVAFETQFVEDNRAALEALRAAAEQLQPQ